MKRILVPARAILASVLLAGATVPAYAQLTSAISASEQATRKAEQTQEQINQLDDQRSDMVREFRTLLQQQDAAELYARQQERVVASQANELASLEEQLGRVEEMKAQMVPMMQDMIAALQSFRAWDLPFKDMTETGIDARADSYEQLTTILDRGDVSPAEQYRFIIEAFQREMEYGRTIDTYTDDVTIGDAVKTVDVFRYGRIALVYVTQDRSEVGRWNRETKAWEVLDGKYKDDIVRGIRIASKVATPAVIMGPVSKLSAQQ
ncbi:MAG: hypothetical protein CME88_07555 [Hirschia sp.]|nr:hypothetical protein [Hirschia sp.]MBF18215.1 hypothetical protein [Hirschia sp.]